MSIFYVISLILVLSILYFLYFRKGTTEKTIEVEDSFFADDDCNEVCENSEDHAEFHNLADKQADSLTEVVTKDNVTPIRVPFTPILTEDQVRTIRAVAHPDIPLLASQYGVSTTTIRNVLQKKTYRDVV